MPNGIYSAAAGMAAQQTKLDAIANDLANSSTTGYKSVRVGFKDLLYGAEQGVAVGSGAIDGAGFFQVKRADGSAALTRNGQFSLDANGALVTSTGEQLDPPIKV